MIPQVSAATSPWTQTDWSGGSGQTSWSDSTKFDSSSNVTTSTAGQATLTQQEKLSNTGFETDLTSWTAAPTTYADSSFSAASGTVAAWPLDDTTTTQSYSRVINPAVTTGRNIILDGGFDDATKWTAGTGWSVTGSAASAASSAVGAVISQSTPMVVGKAYSITFTVTVTSGSVKVQAGTGSSGTTRSSSGTYTETLIATTNSTFQFNPVSTFTGTIDTVSVTQLNIPAYNSTSTQLLSDGDMEAAGTGSWIAGNGAVLSKQTTTPHTGAQLLRVAYGGSPAAQAFRNITVSGQAYRVVGYTRSDGTAIPSVNSLAGAVFTGTTSTSWQPFDVVFVAGDTAIRFRNNTSSGYVEFDDVVVSVDNFIRSGELLQDNDMEQSGVGEWTIGTGITNNAVITKNATNPHGGTQSLNIAYGGTTNPQDAQSVLALGKTYRITGFYRGDGTFAPRVFNSSGVLDSQGTTSTSWQSFDVTGVPTATNFFLRCNATSAGSCDFDDISVTEIDPLSGKPTNGVTLGSASGGHLTNAYTFDGSNDNVNIYSSDLNSAFNPNEGTVILWVKAASSGMWGDGLLHYPLILEFDNNNLVLFYKSNGSTSIVAAYDAGGTSESVVSPAMAGTNWIQLAVTWSKTNDQFKFYINGSQTGATQTGLGTWVGNLGATTTVIGAANTFGSTPWSGLINDVRLYNSALSATDIANLYSGIAATRDTGTKYAGSASSKLVTYPGYNGTFVQSVNVGDTSSYQLEAYAYTTGSAVTSSDLELYYNGAAVTTTFTSSGSGWYKLTGTVTGVASSVDAGVLVYADKTVYMDNMSLWNYPTSATLTSSIFDTDQVSDWGNLTYHATTPSNTSVSVKVRTSNSSSMSGATAFSSCSAISSGTDISSNACVTDGHRYIQYQLTLSSTNTLATSTFEDLSIAFAYSGSIFSLDSPGDNGYTNNDRPTFRWKTASSTSGLSKYALEIDNGDTGDFTINDIPLSGTSNLETNKYIIKYENFSDSDDTNNYISVTTRSSTDWSSDQNDGKVKEGKRSWKVSAVGSNETSLSRTLFVDRTGPRIELTQAKLSTTDATPTIYGKITDPLAAGDGSTATQDENGPKIASGPKQVDIKVEKKEILGYKLITLYTLNFDKPWYTCDGKEISDNSKQKCDKYLPFEYTSKENLDLGTYKITLTGKDKAGNTSSETTLNLNITTLAQIAAPEEKKIIEELEITKPVEPSALEKTGEQISQTSKNIFNTAGNIISSIFNEIGNGIKFTVAALYKGASAALAFVGQKAEQGLAYVGQGLSNIGKAISHGYNQLANNAPGVAKTILTGIGNGVADAVSTITSMVNTVTTTTTKLAQNTANTIGKAVNNTATTVASVTNKAVNTTKEGVANISFVVGEKVQDVSEIAGFALVKIGYLFVNEPTRIADVKVITLDSTSATISWTTNHPANGKINYGLTADYGQDMQSEKRVTTHEFTITDLKPNTTYYYEVMSHNKNYVYDANHTFVTPKE